ncbi:MAG: hypothetical protein CMB65_01565 [Euryarchaeota archaeon]|nr:hypothetical protein [Euryarchaeota archaeon]|tara:strand:+ start:133 stop:978 length:846 start_codon:yes stop_codon:yes gene_type:complete
MVDLSTAMAAAAAGDRRRGGRDGEKKRPGGKVGTEPFDPADHVIKEKADAASMWLVLIYAVLIATMMRYLIMPALDEPASVLWSLPLLLIFTIPPLHKIILSKYAERYTFGNWFRASFLYTFTWLAVCFILVNPPLADISPPEVAERVKFVDLDEPEWNQTVDDFSYSEDLINRNLALVFAVRDNIDAEGVNVRVEITWTGSGQDVWNRTGSAQSMNLEWANHTANIPAVATKSTDVPILLVLDDISFEAGNIYTIKIELYQDGDPWVLTETETHRFVITQ